MKLNLFCSIFTTLILACQSQSTNNNSQENKCMHEESQTFIKDTLFDLNMLNSRSNWGAYFNYDFHYFEYIKDPAHSSDNFFPINFKFEPKYGKMSVIANHRHKYFHKINLITEEKICHLDRSLCVYNCSFNRKVYSNSDLILVLPGGYQSEVRSTNKYFVPNADFMYYPDGKKIKYYEKGPLVSPPTKRYQK